jgi:uncharacterized protein (TIGR02300 family)
LIGASEERTHVANPAWGVKRICPSCGTRYYDFGRALGQIKCPKCDTAFDPEAFLKTRRARTAAVAEKEVEPMAAEEIDSEAETETEGEEVGTLEEEEEQEEGVVAEGEEEEEDEEILEDTSELGEDDDDMAEVIENVDDEEER